MNPALKDFLIGKALDLFAGNFPTTEKQEAELHRMAEEVGKVVEKYKISQLVVFLDFALESLLKEWLEVSVKDGMRRKARHRNN